MDKKSNFNMQSVTTAYKNLATYSSSKSRHHHYSGSAAAVLAHDMQKGSLSAIVNAQEFHHKYMETHKKSTDSSIHATANGGSGHYQYHHQQNHHSHHHYSPHHNQNNRHNSQLQQQNAEAKVKATTTLATPLDHLQAIHTKATTVRTKNEEAINDLRTRIPEIEVIFDIHNRIGNGTFSTVLLATLKKDQSLPMNARRQFAIKHHIPTSHPDRIMKELECMAKIGGTDNVVGINCCLRYNESVAFVMPYLPHDRFHDFFQKMDVTEVQFYMKNLLIALRHVHRFNVIHRDVKPSNFLYNRKKKEFLLVDFGLAQQVPQRIHDSQHGTCPHMRQQQQQLQQQQQQLHTNSQCGINNNNGGGKRGREDDSPAKMKTGTVSDNVEQVKRMKLNGIIEQSNDGVAGGGGGVGCCNGAVANGTSSFKMPLKQINEIQQQKSLIIDSAVPRVAGGSCTVNTNDSNNHTNNTTNHNNNNGIGGNGGGGGGNKYNTNRNTIASQNAKCNCYGNPQVCNICLVKKEVYASRAGTPGYRPPEVLLKYADQTTAVDIWAAGVIFLSVLSSVYPFFKAPNDYMALAEMVTIFGDKAISKTAFVLDRLVTLSQKSKPLDLRKLCVRFRNRQKFSSPEMLRKYQTANGSCEVCNNCDQYFYNCLCAECHYKTEPYDCDDIFPSSAYDLLARLLEVNPHKRITAEEALKHPFITEACYSTHPSNNNNNRLPSTIPQRIAANHHHNHNHHQNQHQQHHTISK